MMCRIRKKSVTSVQMEKFEVPLRHIIDVEVIKVDPATGQQTKEQVSWVVRLAREEEHKWLVSSPDGDTWIEEVKVVPAT